MIVAVTELPLLYVWRRNCTKSLSDFVQLESQLKKNKLFEVDGRHVPQCPIAVHANEIIPKFRTRNGSLLPFSVYAVRLNCCVAHAN